ncbi:MAG: tRNA (adenosine(37)-N6)-threonylcarbamoyltransferase complex transferase subunit TsaD [archaeon]|jgi:universal protein Kae1|nr:tRNA (adenosine(37)-N6)-threonylcarbamoyltransferase complex transferase subunit TsaD [archaeon]
MIVGVECTAHTFGIGIVDKGKILANVKDMYSPASGGIVPMDSAKHHKNVSEKLWNEALEKSGISEKDIDAIALSNAPGLSPCLIAGLHFAKEKAAELGVPIVPVNHCIAHLEIGRSVGAHDPVLLYASGANTQIIAFAAGKYRIFGETLDIGVGNFIDKVARHFGMPFPGGPKLEVAAKTGKYIELPYSIKGMDVSFSGMQTKLQQLFDKGAKVEDLAFSLQETAFPMLVEAAERALAHTGKKELVLGGGVACNSRLQEMCRIMCQERGAKFFCPERSLLVDNAAMIAYTGEIMFNSGIKENAKNVDIKPRERTDEVNVIWR